MSSINIGFSNVKSLGYRGVIDICHWKPPSDKTRGGLDYSAELGYVKNIGAVYEGCRVTITLI